MKNPLKSLVHLAGHWYINKVCRNEYDEQAPRPINERPIEFRFLFDSVLRLLPDTVLDVGTGTTALPSLLRTCGCTVTATDNVRDYWPEGMVNPHWWILDDDITQSKLAAQFDLVCCISVLEHIKNCDAAVSSLLARTKSGGHLVLTFPYNETNYLDNVYQLPGAGYGQDAPYVCQVYSRQNLQKWFNQDDMEIVDQEYWQFFTGRFWTFGERLRPPLCVSKDDLHQLTCLLIRKK
jgi:hypothetical protein